MGSNRARGATRERHDDLAADATSRLSPYLHFGCVSPLEVAGARSHERGGEPFVRQLCWRDFHHQVTAAFGADRHATTTDLAATAGAADAATLEAWAARPTGYPIVDAGMRQLRREGWMHNRARLITASFLTKDLYLDWRVGARHFLRWLVDGDVANNSGNWQWVAGTGNDTRPTGCSTRCARPSASIPSGDYVRRYVAELAAHRRAGGAPTVGARRRPSGAEPRLPASRIVDHAEAVGAVQGRAGTQVALALLG